MKKHHYIVCRLLEKNNFILIFFLSTSFGWKGTRLNIYGWTLGHVIDLELTSTLHRAIAFTCCSVNVNK